MSHSLLKLKSKSTGAIVYDYINDTCDAHNLYDSELNEKSSFNYAEWTEVCCKYEEVDMSQEEAIRVWNEIRTKIINELSI